MTRTQRVRQALRQVKDPCSVSAGRPVDIVSMGLIGTIEDQDGAIRISLVLTEPVCWFSKDIVGCVETAASRVDGVRSVEAVLDHEEIWDPGRMEPSARAILR